MKETFLGTIRKGGDASDPHTALVFKIHFNLHKLFIYLFVPYCKSLLPGTRVQS